MDYVEDTVVELHDGQRGVIVLVRANGRTQYDIELSNGEITTVYHEEVAHPVDLPTR